MASEGALLPSAHSGEEGEQWTRNPLLCWLCDEVYKLPCLLTCYHTFCAACLQSRVRDGRILCPLCGKVTSLKDSPSGLPPPDNLMTFLVETTCEERPSCANCDMVNVASAMFFCSTCGQVLCSRCREETHRARMFSQHDVNHLSKKGREAPKQCPIHHEPYIMFSTNKRTMLCIACFRDSSSEARLHCVDLDASYVQQQGSKKVQRAVMLPGETLLDIDTAYSQARQKLDRAAMSICELQNSVRDGVILFKALLDELRANMDTEKHHIAGLSDELQEAVRKTQEHLTREVDGQYEVKDKLFRSQLASLGALLPIIQVHLLMCTTFSSSATKYEFLEMVFQLMERLGSIAHLSHPLRPGQSSQIRTNFKSEFSRNLEPLISVVGKSRATTSSGGDKATAEGIQAARAAGVAAAVGTLPSCRRSLSVSKLKVMEAGGPFADHCKAHDSKFRDLSVRFSRLKEEATELHREVTQRLCPSNTLRGGRGGRVGEIVRECAALEEDCRSHLDETEGLRAVLDAEWDDQLQRVYAEQEVFQAQINDLSTLRDENKRLLLIAQQLEPYIRSITALMERISPKLQAPQSQGLTVQPITVDGSDVVLVYEPVRNEPHRIDGRSSGDGASRASGIPEDIPKPPDPPQARRGTPDLHLRQDEDDSESDRAHGSSHVQPIVQPPLVGRQDVVAPHKSPSPGDRSRDSSGERTLRHRRRKRQNSEGDSLLVASGVEEGPPMGHRRGSEGTGIRSNESESNETRGSKTNGTVPWGMETHCNEMWAIETKKEEIRREETRGMLVQLLARVRSWEDNRQSRAAHPRNEGLPIRSSSSERTGGHRGSTIPHHVIAENYLDLASCIARGNVRCGGPQERPKSACETQFGPSQNELPRGYSRDEFFMLSSFGGTVDRARLRPMPQNDALAHSVERIRVPKAVPMPQVPTLGSKGSDFMLGEVQAIVHAEPQRRKGPHKNNLPQHEWQPQQHDFDSVYGLATLSNRAARTVSSGSFSGCKKENIYENVINLAEILRLQQGHGRAPPIRQNSWDGDGVRGRGGNSGPSGVDGRRFADAEGGRKGTLHKADSFEGHEEAVKTIVAAVQETRLFRRKKP